MNYKISIIIPAYNRAKIIPATLDSVLAQTYQDWECIVVDDLSKDDTKKAVQQYVEKDSRFRLLTNERKKGAQGARNTGIMHAQSDWVICFDSDNTMHPDMLEKLSSKITADVDVIQCFSSIVDFDTKKKVGEFNWVNEGRIHDALFLRDTYIDFNQAIIRRNKLLEINLLDEDCPSMQEWDTHLRLSNVSIYTTHQECLLDYFVGNEDQISANKKREVEGRFYILEKHISEWNKFPSAKKSLITDIYMRVYRIRERKFRVRIYKELNRIAPELPSIVVTYWNRRIFNFIKRTMKIMQ